MQPKEIILVRGEHKDELIPPETYSHIVKSLKGRGYSVREVSCKLSPQSIRRMREIQSALKKMPQNASLSEQLKARELATEYCSLFHDEDGQDTSAHLAEQNPQSTVFSLHAATFPEHYDGEKESLHRLRYMADRNIVNVLSPEELPYTSMERALDSDRVVFVNARAGKYEYLPQPNLYYIEMLAPGKRAFPPKPNYSGSDVLGHRTDVKKFTSEEKALFATYISDQMHNIVQGKERRGTL